MLLFDVASRVWVARVPIAVCIMCVCVPMALLRTQTHASQTLPTWLPDVFDAAMRTVNSNDWLPPFHVTQRLGPLCGKGLRAVCPKCNKPNEPACWRHTN